MLEGFNMIDYRDYAIELVEDNGFDAKDMLVAALKYMSNNDVKDMLPANEYPDRFEDWMESDDDNALMEEF
jgi:hypothetical protein